MAGMGNGGGAIFGNAGNPISPADGSHYGPGPIVTQIPGLPPPISTPVGPAMNPQGGAPAIPQSQLYEGIPANNNTFGGGGGGSSKGGASGGGPLGGFFQQITQGGPNGSTGQSFEQNLGNFAGIPQLPPAPAIGGGDLATQNKQIMNQFANTIGGGAGGGLGLLNGGIFGAPPTGGGGLFGGNF